MKMEPATVSTLVKAAKREESRSATRWRGMEGKCMREGGGEFSNPAAMGLGVPLLFCNGMSVPSLNNDGYRLLVAN